MRNYLGEGLKGLKPFAVSAWLLVISIECHAATSFSVGTFNLENYCVEAAGNRPAKSIESRRSVVQAILEMRCDMLALQEVCNLSDLLELHGALIKEGLRYEFAELIPGQDPSIHSALLSKQMPKSTIYHTNESFLLAGKRQLVSRGIGEFQFELPNGRPLHLLVVHLKSKRASAAADETEIREGEAGVVRSLLDRILTSDPKSLVAVAGDFNDLPGSKSLRTVLGKGNRALVDPKPIENPGMEVEGEMEGRKTRTIRWTHYHSADETYSCLDYVLLSRSLFKGVVRGRSRVLKRNDWGLASDHRPVMITLDASDLR